MEKHIFLLILLFLVQFPISIASSNETDQQDLLAFQDLITSPSHFLANNWTKNTSFCSWFGVTCSSERQRVIAVTLPNLQLQGTISPSLANLSFLREVNLENNLFHGGIPYGLGHLPSFIPTSLFQHRRVQVIQLSFNKLGGEMWKGPWYVLELKVLNPTNNRLTGITPPSIGNATKLMIFDLSGNRIHGNIPMEIGNLSQLTELYLYNNQLTGFIPATLFNISSLLGLSLGLNRLSSPLLLDEGNIASNLQFISISRNQISGCIPSNICQITEFQALSISFNNITGDIPRNVGCLSKLEVFYISDNAIKGTIPTSLGNISTLQHLYWKLSHLRKLSFGNNYNLTGQVPNAIFNISSLEMIYFNFNNLSGRIPTTTGLHLSNLKQLSLGANQLEGEIPLFITNASKLVILELAQNLLTGTIPTNLGNLRELQGLLLHDNQLTNEPREHELRFFNSLADYRMLKYLDVGYNLLNGTLPNSIGNLSSTIENFNIADAYIKGLIPSSIGNMSGLTALNLIENNLAGSIPPEIGKLKQLQGLYLNNNKLQGHVSEAVCHLSHLVELDMDGNELSGSLPECLGNLGMLLYLSLWKMSGLLYLNMSHNSIEGEVPPTIGELKAIEELHLSSNNFSGQVPSRLGDLQRLKSLDLSNNSFSGSIPLSITNLMSLEDLDLSLNALSGIIPKSLEKLSYLTSINVSFNDLEGEIPSGGVFVNSTLLSFLGNKGLCGMHILELPACPITNPGQQSVSKKLVLKIVTPVVISFFMIFLLSKDVEKVLEIKTYQLISYHEIKRAINYFDGSNLIGEGSSCSVYKGTLSSGTTVAIKVLDLENEQVCKREAHHLNLLQRVTVMLDAAMAIEYLHHGNDTVIVHCEIKPANVLLDEDMVAHVEYGSEGIVSASGDVYSYGIMLMEVLTKRRPTDEEICNENLDLRRWITQSFSGSMMDVVDANLFCEEEQITNKSEKC
ncbi:hypothetical protein R3W88_011180 [Solanum pinnatisectum]|uniref:Leucine-rich repeat-containing N-terminal plant-type domain-containing protein n=1 Tax=Solanum pinnatisectum TaxID=50273 RepID=A0AAV9L6H5_9SOLN|nr:hypothetical protein R3W88_011180 [Solanum pinnatisectum]